MKIYIEFVYEGTEGNESEEPTFNQNTYVVTDLYSRLLNKTIKGVKKIHVKALNCDSELQVFPPAEGLPMIGIDIPFDINHYFALDRYNRRAHLAETLHQALERMCTELGYSPQPFREAYEKVKALDYQNAYTHGKPKPAPDRQHKAAVHIRVEEEFAEISAPIQDKDGNETARIPLIRTLPHYMFIYKYIHSTKWTDSQHFQVSDKTGQVQFVAHTATGQAHMQVQPQKNTNLADVLGDLRMALADDASLSAKADE